VLEINRRVVHTLEKSVKVRIEYLATYNNLLLIPMAAINCYELVLGAIVEPQSYECLGKECICNLNSYVLKSLSYLVALQTGHLHVRNFMTQCMEVCTTETSQ